MNIIWFIDFFIPYYYGGGQARLYELATRLVKKGHKVTVITMRHPTTPDTEYLDGITIKHIGPIIHEPPKRTITDFLRFFLAIRKYLSNNAYDIVCAEGASLLPAQLFSKKPVIATIHDVASKEKDQWIGLSFLSSIAEKTLLHITYKKIITVSSAMKKTLIEKGITDDKIAVITNAASYEIIEKIKPKKTPKNTIVFIGRLIPHKHVDHLITTLKKIREKIPDATLQIFGRGPEEQQLRNSTSKLKLENAVTFHTNSTTEEIIGTLKRATILALPSTREGFGIALAEAAACSKPAVAYDIPAVREVVLHKKTGLLTPPNPSSLADAIITILTNTKLATTMGKQAKKHITKTYNWNKSAEQIEQLLIASQTT